MEIGVPELLIILAIIVILFGVGRVSKIGGEMGNAIREFRQGLKGDEESSEKGTQEAESKTAQPQEAGPK